MRIIQKNTIIYFTIIVIGIFAIIYKCCYINANATLDKANTYRINNEDIRRECIIRSIDESKRRHNIKNTAYNNTIVDNYDSKMHTNTESINKTSASASMPKPVPAQDVVLMPNPESTSNVVPMPTQNPTNAPVKLIQYIPAQKEYNEYLNMIPQNVLNRLYAEGWKIECTSQEGVNAAANGTLNVSTGEFIDTGNLARNIAGITLHDPKRIYIDNRYPSSVIHEVGHAMDSTLGWISNNSETEQVYLAEKDAFINNITSDPHLSESSVEYIAESFDAYVTKPAELQASCPQTYALIERAISQM